jgi:hypothetical protein
LTRKRMESASAGAGSFTAIATPRSAPGTLTCTESASFDGSGSPGEDAVTDAKLTSAPPAAPESTTAVRKSDALSPAATAPAFHCPVPAAYVPCVTESAWNVKPARSESVTSTEAAASGPRFRRVTVNVTGSPSSGVGSSTDIVTPRSAAVTATEAEAESLAATGSGRLDESAHAAAVRTSPAVPGSTEALTNRSAELPAARSPTSHPPVPGFHAPWLVESAIPVSPTGSAAPAATDDDVPAPAFRTVARKTTVSPSPGRESSTAKVTCRSFPFTTTSMESASSPGEPSGRSTAATAARARSESSAGSSATTVRTSIDALSPAAIAPTVHSCRPLANDPWLGTADW